MITLKQAKLLDDLDNAIGFMYKLIKDDSGLPGFRTRLYDQNDVIYYKLKELKAEMEREND